MIPDPRTCDYGGGHGQAFILGLDPGKARCGLAVAQEDSSIALPLAVVQTEPRETLAGRVRSVLAHRKAIRLVTGLPLDQRGREGAAAVWARELAQELACELGVPVSFIDERFTTREAYATRQRSGVKAKRNRESIDAAAATLILQSYLDSRAYDSTMADRIDETKS